MSHAMKIHYLVAALAVALILTLPTYLPAVSAQSQPNLFRIRVIAPSLAYPGETVEVFIETTYNGSLVGNVTTVSFEAHVWLPGQPLIVFLPAPTECCVFPNGAFVPGHFNTTWVVPSNASVGQVEWVHVPGSWEGFSATGVAGITIVPQWLFSPSPPVNASNLEPGSDALVAYAALVIAIGLGVLAVVLAARKRSEEPGRQAG